MSRVAKALVAVPSGVDVAVDGQKVSVKGPKGQLARDVHPNVTVSREDGTLKIAPRVESKENWIMAGTTRALVNNMVVGVSQGFEKKLALVGVGFRAQA